MSVFLLFTLVILQEGMLKQNHTSLYIVVKHCLSKELLPIIKDFSKFKERTIYSDGLKSYVAWWIFYSVLHTHPFARSSKGSSQSKTLKKMSLQIGETT